MVEIALGVTLASHTVLVFCFWYVFRNDNVVMMDKALLVMVNFYGAICLFELYEFRETNLVQFVGFAGCLLGLRMGKEETQ